MYTNLKVINQNNTKLVYYIYIYSNSAILTHNSIAMDYLLFSCVKGNELLNELHVSHNDVSQLMQLNSLPILDTLENYIDLGNQTY